MELNTRIEKYLKKSLGPVLPEDLLFYKLNMINDFPKLRGDLQQTRGFVFLTTAAMAAQVYGCNKVYVGETGPIMFQPKFSSTDIVTRTTHPVLIKLSEKLFSNVFGKKICLVTPFANNTKAEMIGMLPGDIKKKHMSCFDSCLSTRQEDMCGWYYSCVVRRLSSIVAGAMDDDGFEHDVISKNTPKKLVYLASLLEFCLRVKNDFSGISLDAKNMIFEYRKEDLFVRFAEDMLAAIYILNTKPNHVCNDYLKSFADQYISCDPNLVDDLKKPIEYVDDMSIADIRI